MTAQAKLEGRRVLIVADFKRATFAAEFYNSWFALHNGFVRAGAHVVTVSDRDVAREAGLLKHKRFGQSRMNRILVDTVRTYRPHLVVFGHADLTGPDTLEAVRQACSDVRLAQLHLDAVFRTATMTAFKARAAGMDASFITTGAPEKLAGLAPRAGTVAFCPNPVDPSLGHVDVSAQPGNDLAWNGIFLGNGDERREAQVRELQGGLAPDFRFFAGGKIFGTPRLRGPGFLEALAQGAMSPNLPLDETRPVDFLYSSNRIAQLLSLGITAFCQSEARLETLYEDGIVNYSTISDLAEKMNSLAADDGERRRIGAVGRRIGRERTGAERVARYIWEMTREGGPSEDYGWPATFY
jgi:hypothetical protein